MTTSPKSPKRSLPPEFESESEWEYEYSETETEVPHSTSFPYPLSPLPFPLSPSPPPRLPIPFPFPHPTPPLHLKEISLQTHYITLDITSLTSTPTPTTSHKKKKRRDPFHPTIPAPTPRSRRARVTEAARKRLHQRSEGIPTEPEVTEAEAETEAGNQTALEAGDETALEAEASNADANAQGQGRGRGEGEEEGEPEPPSQLQILDLDTTTPLISYRGTIYSCEWTQPLGTDVLLVPPDSTIYGDDDENVDGDEDGEGERRREGNRGSRVTNGGAGDAGPIIAFSAYRLMARPMKAVPLGRGQVIKKKITSEYGAEKVAGTGDNRGGAGKGRSVRFAEPMQGSASVPLDLEEGDVIPAVTASTPEQLPRPFPPPSADTPAPQQPSSTPAPAPSYQSPHPSQPIVTFTATPSAITPSKPSQPASSSLHPESSEPRAPPQRPQSSSLLSSLNPQATPLRTAQAAFLEKLISAKQSHGETDSVTVWATKPPTGTGWGMQAKAKARLVATEPESRKIKRAKEKERKKTREQEVILIEDEGGDEGDVAGDERDAAHGEEGDGEGNERRGEDVLHAENEREDANPGPKRRWGNVHTTPLRTARKDPYAAFRAMGKIPIVEKLQQPVVTPRATFEKDVDTAMRDAGEDRAGEEDSAAGGEVTQEGVRRLMGKVGEDSVRPGSRVTSTDRDVAMQDT